MATKEDKQWWDPYETSNRRQFIYQPNSAAEILLCPTSTSFIDSYSQSGPFGSTVYKKDFCWKPACKPECIRTGTASGQRRNNPHPSQSFMMWRLPRDAAQSSEYVGFQCPPSEGEIRKALTAQYSSIYRCDYIGTPQADFSFIVELIWQYMNHINNTERRLAPLRSRREMTLSTEMRDNYRHPKQKPELLGNSSHFSCSTSPNVACRGIVPTVVQRHAQQKRSDLTNYDRFCGKRVIDVAHVIKSLLPQELQQLHRFLPKEEKEAIKSVLSKDASPNNSENLNKLPAVVLHPCSPEWISSWPGPL